MENKYLTISNVGDCKKFLSDLNSSSYVLNIKIQDDNYDCLKYLVEHSQDLKNGVKIINLTLPYEMMPKKDFEVLYNLWANFPNTKCNVSVGHRYVEDDRFIDNKGTVMWDLKTIIKANTSIYDVCNFIKSKKLSPFEAYAYVHKYVSTIAQYNASSAGGTWLSYDQYFPGAFFDLPEVVCMGYASLEKEIIDNLDMPGLKCDIVSVSFYNKDKYTTDKHARCVVRVLDEKYGINQSCFEDPTWDNIDTKTDKVSMYAHFAMNLDCHERRTNDKYDYYCPSIVELSPKHTKSIVDLTSRWEYNKSKNPISQLQIEKAYFNVLSKSNPKQSFDSLYATLAKMAKQSYDEQILRRFKGNLTQETPLLTKQMAKQIFDENQKTLSDFNVDDIDSAQQL